LAEVFNSEQANSQFTDINQNLTVDNNNASVNLKVAQQKKLETYLDQGSTAELKLTTTDSVTINWSKASCSDNPAALIISIQNTNTSTGAETSRFEAVKGQGCTSGTNFTQSAVGTAPYAFSYTLAFKRVINQSELSQYLQAQILLHQDFLLIKLNSWSPPRLKTFLVPLSRLKP
jgi:hypothetical protein